MAVGRLWAALLCAAALVDCAHPPSELVLRIDSDLDPEVDYDSVRVRFSRVGDPSAPYDRPFDLRTGSVQAHPLPASLVLYARDPADTRALSVRLDAMLLDRVVSSRRATIAFAPQRTVVANIFLARRCGESASCPAGETCGRHGCESELTATEEWRSDALAISAGGNTTCTRTAVGGVRCWGSNSRRQLGTVSAGDRWSTTPVAPLYLVPVQEVSVGGEHACARVPVVGMTCWGGETAVRGEGDGAALATVISRGDLRELAEGGSHGCGRHRDGTVRCWGLNSHGQFGAATPSSASFTAPVQVPGLPSLDGGSIAAGRLHSCVVLTDGRGSCWGDNAQGQLGDGSSAPRSGPVAVTGVPALAAIAPGARHTCAIDRDGAVWCWGANDMGQRGSATAGSPTASRVPEVPVMGLVRSGAEHMCALDRDGRVWCWGVNTFGQVDPAGEATPRLPRVVDGVPVCVGLALGERHTCALTAGGAVWCWGSNDLGQLGDGTTERRTVPVLVRGL